MRKEIVDIVPSIYGKELTETETNILILLWNSRINHETLPSYREIIKELGISSTSEARRHIKILEKKGFLTVNFKLSRAIKLNEDEIIYHYREVSDSA